MSSEPYRVTVKLDHDKTRVSEIHLAPGHDTGEHSHRHDYVVHPRAPAKLVKTSYKNGQTISTEEIEHKPGEPYFVAASADGVTFSLKNVGEGPMLCDKTMIKSK